MGTCEAVDVGVGCRVVQGWVVEMNGGAAMHLVARNMYKLQRVDTIRSDYAIHLVAESAYEVGTQVQMGFRESTSQQ